jgi:tyrosyl-tRNA synthetase
VQQALARELTTLVHGVAECQAVEDAAKALFGQADLAALPPATLDAAMRETPFVEIAPDEIVGGQLPSYADLLARTGLVAGKGAARRTIAEGGAYLNNERVTAEDYAPTTADLLHGRWLVLRRGKRSMGGIHVEGTPR